MARFVQGVQPATDSIYGQPARSCAVLGAILAVTLACIGSVHADPLPVPAPALPCTQAQPLDAYTIAPCTGILWPEPWSKRALECVQVDLPAVSAEMVLRVKTLQAELTARVLTLTACREALDGCELAAEEVIAPDDPWWKHPALWATVGVVAGGLIIGGAWAIHDRL